MDSPLEGEGVVADCMFSHTEKDYFRKFPNNTHAIHATAVSEHGEVVVAYFDGNDDRAMMGAFIVQFTYVNGWTVSFKDISVYPD